MKIIKNILPFILFLFSLQSCAQNDPSKMITQDEFKEKLKDSSIVVLDVRTDEEVKGSLPKIKSAIHIPVQQLGERFNELEKYKDKEIIIVCRTQNRSSKATAFLNEKGFNAKCVSGGMSEYYSED
ncbi:MAG TPA: rhodanese-like domain-containing protein [Ignavibacteriaceae bacterium]|nr:rhodanese-like domain-containing protein [Ignavibacteriaceae bacterium]